MCTLTNQLRDFLGSHNHFKVTKLQFPSMIFHTITHLLIVYGSSIYKLFTSFADAFFSHSVPYLTGSKQPRLFRLLHSPVMYAKRRIKGSVDLNFNATSNSTHALYNRTQTFISNRFSQYLHIGCSWISK